MSFDTLEITNKICYTELVYGRINKKLKSNYSKPEIETMLLEILKETPENCFHQTGKNIYVSNTKSNIRITINSHTYRIITVDRLTSYKN